MTGIKFVVNSNPVNEDFPKSLKRKEIAEFIVSKKTEPFREIVGKNEIIITADTLVWFKEKCWGKPNDKEHAKKMLKMFAGLSHEVITSVGFLTSNHFEILTEVTEVTYKDLNEKEINYYVDTVNPIDKAGSYGIQDWIGYIGITNINGTYNNVMGLPTHLLYKELMNL